MTLDIRLNCLRAAILEAWEELEAKEVDGTLVVRVRDGIKVDEWKSLQPKKCGRPAELHMPD